MNDSLSRLLSTLTIYGDEVAPFAVPADTPAELLCRLQAATKSYLAGYAGVDYLLRTYDDEWNFESKAQDQATVVTHDLLSAALEEVESVTSWWTSAEKEPEPLGVFAAGSALQRCNSSFVVAALLARLGYRYECFAVLRLILEQIAWAYAVRSEQDNDVFSVHVTKSISRLKDLLPFVGRLYSKLSDLAHIHPNLSREYIDFPAKGPTITLRSMKWSKDLAWATAHMAHVFGVATEAVFFDMVPAASRVERATEGALSPRPETPILEILTRFANLTPY